MRRRGNKRQGVRRGGCCASPSLCEEGQGEGAEFRVRPIDHLGLVTNVASHSPTWGFPFITRNMSGTKT